MGSLASGIFGLVAGDPTQQQEGQLNDLGTYETGTGEGATTAANNYYGGILSGDPAEIAKTLAPEIKAGQDQVQQKAQTNSQFGNRSGGVNSSTQQAQSANEGNIISLIGQEQAGAAAGEAGIGSTNLSQASGNIQADAGLKRAQQNAEAGDIGGIVNGAAQIAGDVATGGLSEAADPYQSLYSAQHIGSPVSTVGGDDLTSMIS